MWYVMNEGKYDDECDMKENSVGKNEWGSISKSFVLYLIGLIWGFVVLRMI